MNWQVCGGPLIPAGSLRQGNEIIRSSPTLQGTMPGKHHLTTGCAKRLEQPDSIRDYSLLQPRKVIVRNCRVPRLQHLRDPHTAVAAAVLQVDDDQSRVVPVNFERGPGHVPFRNILRTVDGLLTVHVRATDRSPAAELPAFDDRPARETFAVVQAVACVQTVRARPTLTHPGPRP